MQKIRAPGLMNEDREQGDAVWPKPLRPSSNLLHAVLFTGYPPCARPSTRRAARDARFC
jgi:hypothetical protein